MRGSEDVVDLFLNTIAEAVDCHIIGTLLRRQPDIMDVALHLTLYLPAGVDIVHVSIKNNLEHHLRMVGTPATFTIQLFELLEVKSLNNGVNNTNWVVFRYIFIGIQQKKTICCCYCKILYVNLQYTFNLLFVIKLQKLFDMTKPRLVKVRALFYVLQQVMKRGCAYFDTASSIFSLPQPGQMI